MKVQEIDTKTGNAILRDATEEEMANFSEVESVEENLQEKYEKAVSSAIRQRYSSSQEFSILRQKDEKPEEFDEYYNFCEQIKSQVKIEIFGNDSL